MTYNELKLHVAKLGFEIMIDDEEALALAAERALSLLFLDRAQPATASIYVSAPPLTKVYNIVKHTANVSTTVTLTGSAFSFLPHGNGEYTLTDGKVVTRVEFTAVGGYVKGFITSGQATLRLDGNSSYVITSLASFNGAYGTNDSNIPEYAEHRLVRLPEVIGDFRTLLRAPRYPDGGEVPEAQLLGDGILLPFSFEGKLIIDYYRTPRRVERTDALIDLPSGTEQLFPLLVASFLWLDDDAQKAQYYMALYRDAIARVAQKDRYETTAKYVTNGWA